MPTDKQIAASRENGKKSHGPTSVFGKARAAQNAIVHGLCGKFCVLQSENQEEYNDLLRRFRDAENPIDAVEEELVAKMARSTWMSQRAVRMQSGCFIHEPHKEELRAESKQEVSIMTTELEKFARYQTTHDRAYARAASELAKRRKQREQSERGFASQRRAEAEEARREKRQKQRDQMFELKLAHEKIKLEHDKIRFMKNFDPEDAPAVDKMLQIAA